MVGRNRDGRGRAYGQFSVHDERSWPDTAHPDERDPQLLDTTVARVVADRTLWRRLRANIGPVKSVATEVRELVSMYEELLFPRAALSPPAYCNHAKKGI